MTENKSEDPDVFRLAVVGGGSRANGPSDDVTTSRASRRTGIVMIASCLGFFLINLDATGVNVALPAIGSQLRTGLSALQWVVDGYTVAFAGLLFSAGRVSDRIGASRLFGYGVSGFSLASAACGLASGISVLIVARVVQGVAAAAVLPASLALVRQCLPDPMARARALALWAAGGGAAVAAGPVVGGFLTDLLGWRAIFFVNLPFGLLVLAGLSRAARSVPQRTPVDLPGQLAAVVTLTGCVFATIETESRGMGSPVVLLSLLAFGIGGLWFLRAEATSVAPMVDLRELRSPVFVSCLLTGFALNFAYYGIMFVFSLLFQRERHWSPSETGLAFLPPTVFVLGSNILSGRLTARVGPRYAMTGGLLLEAAGFAGVMAVGAHGPTWLLLSAMVLVGVGGGLASPPMISTMLESVPAKRAGVVSGLLNSCRQAGGAIGVAGFGVLISPGVLGMASGMQAAAATAAGLLATSAVVACFCIPARNALGD
ncbi:MFS transporter [Streptomyces sp. NPDC020800]|uniref:MFS transporter n=1 Tax=Streptomyces sp. NPDC020800 TaxID=3365092 RepID=UPI0037950621